MYRLQGVVRDYDWGDPREIPELLGTPASGGPVAEYWLGAHAGGPAMVAARGTDTTGGPDGSDAPAMSLADAIAGHPVDMLGAATVEQFGARLPFLLKLLAARRALSIQVHPDDAQAAAGFARENAAGVPLDAPERTFKDPWHKPEMMLALRPFRALCGFRDPHVTDEAVSGLVDIARGEASGLGDDDVAALRSWQQALSAAVASTALRDGLALLLADRPRYGAIADRLAAALTEAAGSSGTQAATGESSSALGPDARLVTELHADYPGDVGVLVALMLNPVELQPGQALTLRAGVPHAYLHGMGVEIMAASDNVIRCGLTGKHVDAPLLSKLVDYRVTEPTPARPDPDGSLPAEFPDFALRVLESADGTEPDDLEEKSADVMGPTVVLCTRGEFTLTPAAPVPLRSSVGATESEQQQAAAQGAADSLRLLRGQAAFIPASDGPVRLAGMGSLCVAGPGPTSRTAGRE